MLNKPVFISPDDLKDQFKHLAQTAAQIGLMSGVFSLFGQPYAHNCPDVRQVLLTVLEITAICLSRRISVNILGHLKYLIKEG